MQRYFIRESEWQGNEVIINGDDAHHIIRVMRNKVGDNIICNHQNGEAAVCVIVSIDQHSVRANVSEWLVENAELPIEITIAQGLPKGDKLELILQKGTELGAHTFIPVKMDRSVVVWDERKMAKKMTRYAKIVKEASEQSHRNKIPEVVSPIGLRELINEGLNFDVKIFAYEEEAKVNNYQSLATIFSKIELGQKLLVCIGPEGGFSNQEAEQLMQHGFHSVRLGPRILRTETASLYVLASLSYHFEEWKEKNG